MDDTTTSDATWSSGAAPVIAGWEGVTAETARRVEGVRAPLSPAPVPTEGGEGEGRETEAGRPAGCVVGVGVATAAVDAGGGCGERER